MTYAPFTALSEIVCLQHSMYDGNIRAGNLVHCDVAGLVSLIWRVRQEEKVATVESGFHRATGSAYSFWSGICSAHTSAIEDVPEHDHNWRLGVRDESQAFPYHEPGCEDRHEVENLQQHLETEERQNPSFEH